MCSRARANNPPELEAFFGNQHPDDAEMQEQGYGGADVARCQDVRWIENGEVERYQKQWQSIQTGWGRFDLAPPQTPPTARMR